MLEPKPVQLIVCTDNCNAIGYNGRLLYHISADLRRFAALTKHTTMIMGRKTFESLPKILDNRKHVVVSSKPRTELSYPPGDVRQVTLVRSVEEGLTVARVYGARDGITVIGGAEIYRYMLDRDMIDVMQITHVKDGGSNFDTVFPGYDPQKFELIKHSDHEEDGQHFTFYTYHKRGYGMAEEIVQAVEDRGSFLLIHTTGSPLRIAKHMIGGYACKGELLVDVLLTEGGADTTLRFETRKHRDQAISELDAVFLTRTPEETKARLSRLGAV